MSLVDVVQKRITQFTHGANLSTSDEALDRAADFQRGFQTYIGLYNEYTGSGLTMEIDVQRPYDQLRGIDFGRLKDVAEKTAQLGDDLEEKLQDINTQVGTVSAWTGDAATAFRGYIQQFQTCAQSIDESLEDIATRTADAVPAVQAIIAEYVDGIGDIDFSDFDSPEIVELLIRVQRLALSIGDLIRELSDRLGDLLGIVIPTFVGGIVGRFAGSLVDLVLDWFGLGVDEFLEWVAGKAREYLDRSFKDPFEANLQLLHDLVGAAERGTAEAFRPLIEAAHAVPVDPFTSLPVPPEDDPGQRQSEATQDPRGGHSLEPRGGHTHAEQPGGRAEVGLAADRGGVQPTVGPPPPAHPVPAQPAGVTSPVAGASGSHGPGVPAGDLPQPVSAHAAPSSADVQSGRPGDMPAGAGWIADPSQLPQGWTVDRMTGELSPPGAPQGSGDPEVHSPLDQHAPAGSPGAEAVPATDGSPDGTNGGPSSVTVRDGDVKITVTADRGSGDGIQVTLTDGDGDTTQYQIRIGDDGRPQLVPVETAAAEPVGPTPATRQPGGPDSGGFVVADIAQSLNPDVEPVVPTAATEVPPTDAPAATVAAAVGFGVGTDSTTGADSSAAATGYASDPNLGAGVTSGSDSGSVTWEPTVADNADTDELPGAQTGPLSSLTGAVSGSDVSRETGAWPAADDEVLDAAEAVGQVHGLNGKDR